MGVEEKQGNNVGVAKKHVLKYCEANDSLAWKGIALTLIYQGIALLLINFGYDLLGWTLNTFVIVRMFVQFHDMAHFSYFRSMSLNKVVGSLLGVYVHFPFQAWRDGHNHHHKHFGNLDRLDLSQTILMTKNQYLKMSTGKRILMRIFRQPIVFFLFTAPFVWFFGTIIIVAKRYGLKSKPFCEKIASLAFIFFILPLLGVSSLRFSLSIWGTNIVGTILFHLQHSVNVPYRKRKASWNFQRAALEGSTYLEVPRLLKPFTYGIEYHHIHHLNTKVASYAIQECHEAFNNEKSGENWEACNINEVDFGLACRSLLNVMLDEENGKLISFYEL